MRLGVARSDKDPEEDASDVGIENRLALTEGEAEDSSSGVLANPLERHQGLFVGRQLAAVAGHRLARDRMEPSRANVVSEGTPGRGHVGFRGVGQCLHGWILPQPFVIFRQHSVHLRLLEHDLRDEYVVRIGGVAPGQVASVAAVPFEQAAAEPLPAGGQGKCLASLVGFYNQKVKIYTRTGDAGETALFDGTRVSKADPRVAAYGEVDELNAWLGLARASLEASDASIEGNASQLPAMVEQIQRDLFALGARLADPAHKIAERVRKVNVSSDEIVRLEGWIDLLDSELPPLRRFILAGGSPAGAAFHIARTVCRRAERAIIGLGEHAVDPEVVVYVNRLSDLLFVLARAVNTRAGKVELEW